MGKARIAKNDGEGGSGGSSDSKSAQFPGKKNGASSLDAASSSNSSSGRSSRKILFRYGELIRLSPGGGGRCGRGRGMGGQDGLRAGADAR